MQSYVQSLTESHNQPLDFTSKNITAESPILDLSCKKQDPLHHHQHRQQQKIQPHVYNLSPVSLEMRTSSPSREATSPNCDNSHQSQQTAYGEERKSPIEVRTFMVTPPSESDSPKKQKFLSMYPKLNLSGMDMLPRYPRLAMNMPLPMSPVLSTLLSGESMPQIQMPAMPTPLTMISTSTSGHHDDSAPLASPEPSKKGPRPFKAYPKDPLSMSMGPAELVHDPTSNEAYNEFRKRMLESVRRSNEGTNIKMRRVSKSPSLPTSTMDDKDAAYWERRRKNNEAAKRSRDARRAKEDEIAIRAAFLEQENMQLKCELVALRSETVKLRRMIFTS